MNMAAQVRIFLTSLCLYTYTHVKSSLLKVGTQQENVIERYTLLFFFLIDSHGEKNFEIYERPWITEILFWIFPFFFSTLC